MNALRSGILHGTTLIAFDLDFNNFCQRFPVIVSAATQHLGVVSTLKHQSTAALRLH